MVEDFSVGVDVASGSIDESELAIFDNGLEVFEEVFEHSYSWAFIFGSGTGEGEFGAASVESSSQENCSSLDFGGNLLRAISLMVSGFLR